MTTTLRLELLGGFTASWTDGERVERLEISSKKGRALLCHLALTPRAEVTRDALMALLWPDRSEQQARTSLRKELSSLRKMLSRGDETLLLTPQDAVRLDGDAVKVDVREVLALAEQGGDGDGGAPDVERVLDLVSGSLLAGFFCGSDAFDEWLAAERQRIDDAALALLGAVAEAPGVGAERAHAALQRGLRINPLREQLYRRTMALLAAEGRRNEALRVYETCQRVLADELGVEPDAQTQALRERILADRADPAEAPCADAAPGADDAPDDAGDANADDALDAPDAPDAVERDTPRAGGRPTVAVLPFRSLGGDADDEYLADGISEDIITELARFAELFVIARTSSFTHKGSGASVGDIARDLGAQYVVLGSIRRAGSRIRANVQLVEAATNTSVWAQRFDRELGDVFELEDAITSGVVGVLPGRIASHQTQRIAREPPENLQAYEALLAGRVHHHRFTADDNARAFELIEHAIALEPDYAAAWAWKACLLGQAIGRGYLPDPPALVAQAKDCVRRALALDDNELEAHRVLAEIHLESREWVEAEHHNARALALNPNDTRVAAQKGELLTWTGRAAEGVEWIREAMRLDPYAASSWGHLLGRALLRLGQHAEAVAAYRTCGYPRAGHLADMAACLTALGESAAAERACQRALGLDPTFSVARTVRRLLYREDACREHHQRLLEAAPLPD